MLSFRELESRLAAFGDNYINDRVELLKGTSKEEVSKALAQSELDVMVLYYAITRYLAGGISEEKLSKIKENTEIECSAYNLMKNWGFLN
ncbi:MULTISPECIES: hypothetical protein [Aerococcus]|uniref:hypothetical protein n=1 Tax=Aerococcus TaxID=1375 RepID=UPI000DCEE003|nr:MULTISPECIES: hypothetical protein [Aerococcus]KAA9299814.1 hypothetical protein F6I08_00130 [Aerococcus tenax]MDK8133226.1 hypothetical protein [Aerococcus urinae]MDK8485365.1 hypothetical protein [Aerococcus urinae]MDL5178302.1 hypothetical protein [Aerococcus tenax]MDL5207317.1 hypothetical protein [Aerococcus tenax]